jgi:hypothetical protein
MTQDELKAQLQAILDAEEADIVAQVAALFPADVPPSIDIAAALVALAEVKTALVSVNVALDSLEAILNPPLPPV